jgi:protein phosphatase
VTALAIMWQGTLVTDSAPTSTQASSTVISTEALPDDLVSTTIHGKSDVDMFDDDEIEKAIAEIRGAIEKSSQILK